MSRRTDKMWKAAMRVTALPVMRPCCTSTSNATHADDCQNKPKLQRDPAGRYCPDCAVELQESIPLDSNGTCHGCGSCFGVRAKA